MKEKSFGSILRFYRNLHGHGIKLEKSLGETMAETKFVSRILFQRTVVRRNKRSENQGYY